MHGRTNTRAADAHARTHAYINVHTDTKIYIHFWSHIHICPYVRTHTNILSTDFAIPASYWPNLFPDRDHITYHDNLATNLLYNITRWQTNRWKLKLIV